MPKEAVDAYRYADYWKLFSNIFPIDYHEPADVNGDYVVNITDVNTVIDVILNP